jgi:hypothetical protein
VIGIISILASLLLVAVLKAKHFAQHKTFQITAHDSFYHIEQQLGHYYGNQTNFPVLTADQLNQKGVFDFHTMTFLNNPEVKFYPFASSDADNKIILWVAFHTNDIWVLVKTNATHPSEE